MKYVVIIQYISSRKVLFFVTFNLCNIIYTYIYGCTDNKNKIERLYQKWQYDKI